ncbi:hypothetical protein NIES592_03895 [Fischerella major NIES-592]|uniref:GNAT family N-acetyltransferase n=2 Tax=Fischerella TaxID=1190 RepID=A0A1U7H2E2_9CYAN|nr:MULTISPECIES: hypothetical protein [Fischerella]OKH15258.1 hypothetical protein NIES592_03895 [Fischerella major NIES-592]PMB41508.1 hypothetical protein CEN41_17145 [Fischerella thermalis CCMEE 5330]BAU04124.1 hypothetical protein FIS3754_00070 [Fischerella sp. NIES-3754]BCX06547.1 MAG: hypothetical protein KatS3mg066_0406 [Fischerella sp.]
MRIEPYDKSQLDAINSLSLRTWTPVFDSIQQVMDFGVYHSFYPNDWAVTDRQVLQEVVGPEQRV